MRLYKKVLKENVNLFADHEYLKFTNITHAFKQGYRNFKGNCRPKRLMYKQLLNCFDNIFSNFQCGFQKGFGKQHCLLLIIDKRKRQFIAIKFLVQFLLTYQKLLIKKLIAWFANNQMKANHRRCHLWLSTQDMKVRQAYLCRSKSK